MTDEQLMLHCQGGDTRAFDELVARYRARLYNFILRSVGEVDLAEDVLQEVFIRAFQARERYAPQAKFATWLYRIATNACHNARASRAYRDRAQTQSLEQAGGLAEADVPPLIEALPDGQPGPLEVVLADELQTALFQALRALPPPYRTVLLLRHVEDLSYAEISAILDVPEGTLKVRAHRGRLMLRQQLRPYLEGEA
jgi:RNA polymerase sigma-70 factor (ECF subfamily)